MAFAGGRTAAIFVVGIPRNSVSICTPGLRPPIFFKIGPALPKKTTTSKPGKTWKPRPYQVDSRRAFDDGKRRQLLIWHRRAGKDTDTLDFAANQAMQTVGTYWHLYPTHTQARRAIWNGIDARAGIKFLERAFPLDERKSTLKQDMTIELNNGSIWQLAGSDRYDSLVGSNPVGVSFSEWALCDPRAWDYVRPILRENGGWCRFITTYRGKNHAYRMAKRLADNPEWYVDIRTVEDTTHSNGRRILTDADIDAEREEGMSEAMIQQEYYCNPIAALPGAIYGRAMEKLIAAKRLGSYAYDSSLPVMASWALEWDSQYTVIFWQTVGSETRLVGSKSYPFEALSDCLDHVSNAFPWRYISRHIVSETTSPEMLDIFERRGCIIDTAASAEGVIPATRDYLASTYIDNKPRDWCLEDDNNERLVDALNGYRFTEHKGGQSFTNTPVNSWERYYARAVEVFAINRQDFTAGIDGWHTAPNYAATDARVI